MHFRKQLTGRVPDARTPSHNVDENVALALEPVATDNIYSYSLLLADSLLELSPCDVEWHWFNNVRRRDHSRLGDSLNFYQRVFGQTRNLDSGPG